MFDQNFSKYNNLPCLISDEYTVSYQEVDAICSQIEALLPEKKQLILIKSKVNIGTIVGYLSFLRKNHTIMMLDASVDDTLMQNLIEIYRPNFIWEEVISTQNYVVTYKDCGLKVFNPKSLNLHPNLALMLSTSGTTGSPKMVKLTKENLYANTTSIIQYLDINSAHRAITNLPLYYSYGLSILNTHLKQGASIVITDESIMSKNFWNIFKTHNVTTLSGVPYHYEILRRIGLMKMDLPSLKYMTQAGGKLNQKLVKVYATWAKEKEIDFCVMYGQTEATARMSYLPTDKTLDKMDSIGIAIPNGTLQIKDLNNDQVIDTANIEGELVYSGKNVMMGYATCLNDLEKNDELHGVLRTGDLARQDEEGYLYITGRLKRFIKIHGNRVGLDEIEHHLKSLDFDVLCTGVDNKLMVASRDEDKIEIIKQKIIDKYTFHHSVVKVKYINEYPVSDTGKIQYKKLIGKF